MEFEFEFELESNQYDQTDLAINDLHMPIEDHFHCQDEWSLHLGNVSTSIDSNKHRKNYLFLSLDLTCYHWAYDYERTYNLHRISIWHLENTSPEKDSRKIRNK